MPSAVILLTSIQGIRDFVHHDHYGHGGHGHYDRHVPQAFLAKNHAQYALRYVWKAQTVQT